MPRFVHAVFLVLAATLCAGVAGCAGDGGRPADARTTGKTKAPANRPANLLSINRPETSANSSLRVSSPAFRSGGTIPPEYSDAGQKISPALSWSDVPQGTQSIAVLAEDPDAAEPKPFVHWLLYNLPPDRTDLREAVPGHPRLPELGGVLQGLNSRGSAGYFGPKPPKGDPPHDYHFQVFALDRVLDVDPLADRETLLKAMNGHVLAKGELVGTFQTK